jgi:hypothetical protein
MVTVIPGKKSAGITISLRRAESLTIRGRIQLPPDKPLGEVLDVCLYPEEFTWTIVGSTLCIPARLNGDGTFEATGVPPGKYALMVTRTIFRPTVGGGGVANEGPVRVNSGSGIAARRPSLKLGGTSWRQVSRSVAARLDINVTNADISGLSIPVSGSVLLAGRVRVEGRDRPEFEGAYVYLRPTGGLPTDLPHTSVTPNGEFAFEGLSALRYNLLATGLPANTYVKSVRLGDQDVLQAGVDLRQAASPSAMEVFLGERPATVEGVVREGGVIAKGALVALVAMPFRLETALLTKTAAADQNGRFRITGVSPGDYLLYVRENWPLAVSEDVASLKPPESGAGLRLTVREDERVQVELSAPGR